MLCCMHLIDCAILAETVDVSAQLNNVHGAKTNFLMLVMSALRDLCHEGHGWVADTAWDEYIIHVSTCIMYV